MRIMQVLSGIGVNGAVLQCFTLTRALADRGHHITLVCRPNSWISKQPFTGDVDIVYSNLQRWPLDDLRSITRLVRRNEIEIIHTHQSRAHFFGILLRWMAGKPCIATAHARHLQPHWRFNNFVIANSEATYQFQRRWNFVPEHRMQVIHYLLDLEQFAMAPASDRQRLRQDWNISLDCPVAGIIGDVIPRKGHVYAVRAWADVHASIPDAQLLIVGEEKDPKYSQLVRDEAKRLAISDRILWTGYRRDIPSVMQALDVCVSAATEEALGLTIPEAMAAGRPVVATNVGGVPENLVHDETGLLVPPADPSALASALTRVLSNDAWRQECGQRAWRLVREKYDPKKQLAQVEAIYEQLARAA